MQVLDYSGGYPRAAIVKQRGYVGVLRYLRKEGTSHVQPLTSGEYQDMTAQGLGVGLLGEHVKANRALDGYDAGRHDALWWVDRAREVGVTTIRALYLTVDFDANPDSIVPYFQGARTVLGNANGGYGSFRVLETLFNLGLIDWGMQTYAWSRGHNIDPKTYEQRAHLFQRLDRANVDGIDCDISDVLHEDWGATNIERKKDDVLTPNDGNVQWAAQDPDTGVVESHEVAHWLGIPAYRSGRIQVELTALAAEVAEIKAMLRDLVGGGGVTIVSEGQIVTSVRRPGSES